MRRDELINGHRYLVKYPNDILEVAVCEIVNFTLCITIDGVPYGPKQWGKCEWIEIDIDILFDNACNRCDFNEANYIEKVDYSQCFRRVCSKCLNKFEKEFQNNYKKTLGDET